MHESLLLNVGLPTPEGSYHNAGAAMTAQIKNEIIIYSFTIDQNFTGDLTIYFDNKTTGEIKRKTVNIQSTGVQDIILNVELKPGRYYIGRDDAQNTPLKRTPYNVQFPFTNNDITLIGSTTAEPKWYYYWFNIKYYRKKILHYDFQECGEPTTNLINTIQSNGVTLSTIDKGYEFTVVDIYDGLKLTSTNGFIDNEVYTLSYKLKLISGSIETIGGHIDGHNNVEISINSSKFQVATFDGISDRISYVMNINEEVYVQERFTGLGTTYIYIQPNRGLTKTATVQVTNIQIEKKDHQTPFVIGSREGKVLDKSGYNFHQAINEQTSPIWQKSVINNYQYKFNGITNYMQIQNFYYNYKDIESFTVNQWVKIPLDGGDWSIIDFDRSEYFTCQAGIPKSSYSGNGDYVGFHSTNQNGTINDMWSNQQIRDNKWHFISWKYDKLNKTKYIYIDKVLDSTQTVDSIGTGVIRYGFIGDGSEQTTFNGSRNNIYFKGEITDVRVYQTQLTDQEIKDIYNKTKKTKVEEKRNIINTIKKPVSNLVLYYKFDEFVESTENFCSDNNPYYGDIGNSVWIESEKLYGTKTTSDWYDLGHCYGTMTVQPGDYIQISFEQKIINSQIDHTLNIFGSDTNSAGMSIRTYSQNKRINLTNGEIVENTTTLPADGNWYKFIWIYQIQTFSGQPSWRIEEYGDNSEQNKYILHRKIQFEKKDHQTPFTPSIRNGYITDYSGNNNYGRIYLGSSPKYIEQEKQYEFGNGDISNIKIEVPEIVIPKEQITVNLWQYQTDNGSNDNPLITYSDSTSFQTGFQLWNGYGTDMRWTVNGNQILKVINNMYNSWHMYTGTYDSITGDSKFYYDGILQDSINLGQNVLITNSTRNLTIGNQLRNSNQSFSGKIKDVRIYNKQLSQNQIKQLYNQTKWS